MASISRLARCGSRMFSTGSRATATGRGKVHEQPLLCVVELLSFCSLLSAGRGYSTPGSSSSLRCVGVSVGALLAGSAVAYGGNLLYKREGSPPFFPTLQADTHAHQPSVSTLS